MVPHWIQRSAKLSLRFPCALRPSACDSEAISDTCQHNIPPLSDRYLVMRLQGYLLPGDQIELGYLLGINMAYQGIIWLALNSHLKPFHCSHPVELGRSELGRVDIFDGFFTGRV